MAKKVEIPALDLKREYDFLRKDIARELRSCFESQQWILGEKVTQFEEKAAKYLGVKHAIGVASGTDALLLSLRALAIKEKNKEYFDKKDEVITTPFTFVATAEAIVRSGATPVFVDVNLATFNICPGEIKKAITKNTVGILPVHLYGNSCRMDEILKIAKENNLFVVEDTAQAFGGTYSTKGACLPARQGSASGGKGKKLGTIGNCGAFSFFPSKNLGGCGDGGLIATNNIRLAELVRILRNHGQIKKYNASYIGYNSRLDSIQAAILLVKLKYVDKFNQLRREIAKKYNEAFKDIKQLQTPKPLTINHQPSTINQQPSTINYGHVYHLYTIKVTSGRDELLKFLNSSGIDTRPYYPILLSKMKAFKNCKIKGDLKNAKDLSKKILSLPIHPFLKDEEIDYVISTVKKFFKK
ncbi:MAG: DegT/DnrJ/EryC1/StrS family aminotransferase [Candidatus Omnitrophica bacterium]|nr:DegT/DnrJ/EryC1/StrS family aminotransferase [Candidatus Omnitrophota bacterium]MBU0896565.1 DegT/DnrJ/EryC1/StrS family aminotransferase [Candidatus Omnitrophota bacterium]MBU1811148.1 DegT/DnrJ/EryC1/StrS family aminotransferase [Candidatus Omnitrophota bacterium]